MGGTKQKRWTVSVAPPRFFLQTQEGDKAEAYLRKGALSIMPDHGDGLADLAVAMSMQGAAGNPDKMSEAMSMIQQAEQRGASGSSFDKRRYVFGAAAVVAASVRSSGGIAEK